MKDRVLNHTEFQWNHTIIVSVSWPGFEPVSIIGRMGAAPFPICFMVINQYDDSFHFSRYDAHSSPGLRLRPLPRFS